jgi:hypothetical protein
MMPGYLLPLSNHLWQSSLFAAVAAVLTFVLRKNSAAVRYWVWFVATLKFFVPFSAVMALGNLVEWRVAPAISPPQTPAIVMRISELFRASEPRQTDVSQQSRAIPTALFAIWVLGVAVSSSGWMRAWLRIRSTLRGLSSTAGPRKRPLWQKLAAFSSVGRLRR